MSHRHKTGFSLLLLCALAALAFPTPGIAGIVMITGDDADDSGHCQGVACGALFVNTFNLAISTSTSPGSGIVAIGVNGGYASVGLNSWNSAVNGGPGLPITVLTTAAQIASVDFADYDMVYIPSVDWHTFGGINGAQLGVLNTRAADLLAFVNTEGGSLIALTEADISGGWGWLPFGLTTVDVSFIDAVVTSAMTTSPGVSPTTSSANLSHCCFHNVFTSASVAAAGFVSLANAGSDAVGLAGNPTHIFATLISPENCTDGIDNDGDSLVDGDDPDCQICGDGDLDPGEACDDGNLVAGDGCDAQCELENSQCVAMCQDVTVSTDPGACSASASIDDGSSDPDGDPLTLTQSPAEPYAVGATSVTLSCTDGLHSPEDTCTGTVTVEDHEPPAALCNAPGTITPPDAPIAFTGGGTDNCSATVVVTGFDCFKFTTKGKRIDKTESCVVSIDGDTITIQDSGGVDDHITWTVQATDSSGNVSTTECEIVVANPGQRQKMGL